MADITRPPALDEILKVVAALEVQVLEAKQTANQVARLFGRPPEFDDAELEQPRSSGAHIRSDQFANFNAQSSAARAFLEHRGKSIGAASFDDIFTALKLGGYPFEGNEEQNKANLKVALGKDGRVFRLTNGTYGMVEWYPNNPNARRDKPTRENKAESSVPAEAPARSALDRALDEVLADAPEADAEAPPAPEAAVPKAPARKAARIVTRTVTG